MNTFKLNEVKITGFEDISVGKGNEIKAYYNGQEIGCISIIGVPGENGEVSYLVPEFANVKPEYQNQKVGQTIIKTLKDNGYDVKFAPDTGNTNEIHYSEQGRALKNCCVNKKYAEEILL